MPGWGGGATRRTPARQESTDIYADFSRRTSYSKPTWIVWSEPQSLNY